VMAFEGKGADGQPHRYVIVRLGKTQDTRLRAVMNRIGDVVDGLARP